MEEITQSVTLQQHITHYDKKYNYYHSNSLSLCGIFLAYYTPLY